MNLDSPAAAEAARRTVAEIRTGDNTNTLPRVNALLNPHPKRVSRKAGAAIIVLMPVRPNAKLLAEVVVVVGRPVVCVVNLTAKLDMIQYTY
jgi:hypothetical protein